MKKFIPAIAACLLYTTASLAQQSDSSAAPTNKNEWIAGVTVNSGLNYYGRVDSLHSRGAYPFVGVNFKNGLFLLSDFIFVNNALTTSYAATIVQGRYRYENKKKTWSAAISGARFFYRDNSTLVQSAVKGQAGLLVSNSNKILNVTVGGDAKFSDQTDFEAYGGVDHIFRFDKIGHGVIVVDPSAYVYSGTQHFSKTYLQQKKFLIFPAGEETVTKNSSQFNILSYELSCPVIYGLGKMNLIITPAYVLPQNVITDPDQPAASENAQNMFYATATLRFYF